MLSKDDLEQLSKFHDEIPPSCVVHIMHDPTDASAWRVRLDTPDDMHIMTTGDTLGAACYGATAALYKLTN